MRARALRMRSSTSWRSRAGGESSPGTIRARISVLAASRFPSTTPAAPVAAPTDSASSSAFVAKRSADSRPFARMRSFTSPSHFAGSLPAAFASAKEGSFSSMALTASRKRPASHSVFAWDSTSSASRHSCR